MLVALLVLAGLLASGGVCLLRPSLLAALVHILFSAVWLSANNGHIEGRVLYSVDSLRGFTEGDLASYGGFVIAIITVLRWWRAQLRRPSAAAARSADAVTYIGVAAVTALLGVVVVLGLGLVFDWVHQPA